MFYLSDLDLTLLKSDLSLGEYSIKVWNEAVNRGKKLSIATARSFTGVKKLLSALSLKEPMILLDGVMIADIEGNILSLNSLNRDIAQEIVAVAQKAIGSLPLSVGLDSDDRESFVYPKKPNIYQEELLKKFHNDRRVISSSEYRVMDRNLKLVYMEDEARSEILESSLREHFGDSIEIKRSKDPYIDCYFITILHPKGDKAHALATLEEIEGVSIADTTVFGDSHNDIGLFKYAGRKVAVANAIDEIKKSADIVLKWSNDEDAVAKFIAQDLNINSNII